MNKNINKDVQLIYNKTKKNIDKHGHTILGTIDGKGNLERPFAYSIGASHSTNYEFISFFPVKDKGLSVVSKVINKIINTIKNDNFKVSSKIIKDDNIYYLPIIMYVLKDYEKKMIQSQWARQLEHDGFLNEFTKQNHELVVVIFSDKNGILPWDSKCESFWPDICPLPILASAELDITGNDNLMCKLENDLGID